MQFMKKILNYFDLNKGGTNMSLMQNFIAKILTCDKMRIVTSNDVRIGKIVACDDNTIILQTETEVISLPDNYVVSEEVAIQREHIETIGEWKR